VFWRWGDYIDLAVDGCPPFLLFDLPQFKRRTPTPPDDKRPLIAAKLKTIIDRGYLTFGSVKSLIQFFDVPNADDIRLVYNGQSCGLNKSTCAPNFWLPNTRTALRSLDYNYYALDMDLGEIFLNFPLHHSLQSYSGVDVTPYKVDLQIFSEGVSWLHWTRTWMGSRPSPYNAVFFYYLAEEFIRGNEQDKANPFFWDELILNLPGSSTFDPTRPKVIKWDSSNEWIACDLVVFVDDLRGSGPTVELTWALSRVVASRIQYLDIQEASRKRRPPTRTPGAWAGGVFRTSSTNVCVSVSQDKWDKAQRLVKALWDVIEQADASVEETKLLQVELDYKELEISRGFLVHLSMTFEMLKHHLKGFHLALASHLPGRSEDGWKMSDTEWCSYLLIKVEKDLLTDEEAEILAQKSRTDQNPLPPKNVPLIKHLKNDIFALREFFNLEKPPEVQARRQTVHMLLYGFTDASGGGVGSTINIPGVGIRCRIGVWGKDDETQSSNFKEFENVVQTIEEEARNGTLNGASLYLFTDNSTVEGALFEENTPSRKLFHLIVRFRKVQ
jgi:hypothetical protein